MFAPLTTEDVRSIARAYLLELERTMAKAGRTIEVGVDALELIVAEGYSVAFGARFLKRVIEERIKLPPNRRSRLKPCRLAWPRMIGPARIGTSHSVHVPPVS